MKHWRLVVYGTCLWSINNGITMLLRGDIYNGSTLGREKTVIGWMMILSGLFMLAINIDMKIYKKFRSHTIVWIELGLVCASFSTEIPMAVFKTVDHEISWSETLNLSNTIIWSILITIGLWVTIVIPGIEIERRYADLEQRNRAINK